MRASDALERVLVLIPDEESWWRGDSDTAPWSVDSDHCVMTALHDIAMPERHPAHLIGKTADYLQREIDRHSPCPYDDVTRWNDDEHTTFADFQLVVKRAANAAREAGD